jgi:hypothetical protein
MLVFLKWMNEIGCLKTALAGAATGEKRSEVHWLQCCYPREQRRSSAAA